MNKNYPWRDDGKFNEGLILDQSRPFPQITFRVKTYDPLELHMGSEPGTSREAALNQILQQTVWVEYWPYPLKNGDTFTLYGEEALTVYKNLSNWSQLEVAYYGQPTEVTPAPTPNPTPAPTIYDIAYNAAKATALNDFYNFSITFTAANTGSNFKKIVLYSPYGNLNPNITWSLSYFTNAARNEIKEVSEAVYGPQVTSLQVAPDVFQYTFDFNLLAQNLNFSYYDGTPASNEYTLSTKDGFLPRQWYVSDQNSYTTNTALGFDKAAPNQLKDKSGNYVLFNLKTVDLVVTPMPTASPTPTPTPAGPPIFGWGNNQQGNLGVGDNVHRSMPTHIVGTLYDFRTIKGNSQSNAVLGIGLDGKTYGWGLAIGGALGNNKAENISSPVTEITNSTNWVDVATNGSIGLFVKSDGSLWSCGFGIGGRLGNSIVNRSTPAMVGTDLDWDKVFTSGYGSFAIKKNGSLWSWGINNQNNTLGINSAVNSFTSSPVQVFGGDPIGYTQIDSSLNHTAAIKANGTLWLWGSNSDGALGNNTVVPSITSLSPVQEFTNSTWKYVSCGYGFTVGLKTDNTVWTWGLNNLGQLGTGNTIRQSSPCLILGNSNQWLQIATTKEAAFALNSNGDIWAWGFANYGELDNNKNFNSISSPTQIALGRKYKTLFANGNSVHAIEGNPALPTQTPASTATPTPTPTPTSAGIYYSWGNNSYGELGRLFTGSTDSNPANVLTNFGTATKFANNTNSYNFALINSLGELWIWGSDISGNLGNNTLNQNASSPIQTIAGGTNWYNITLSNRGALAVKSDGTLWGWGNNYAGQLGNNNTINASSPLLIDSANSWENVFNSNGSSYGIKKDGTLWSWGVNSQGQLANLNTDWTSSPIQVIDNSVAWKKIITAGSDTVAGIKSDDTLWLWGNNSYGQLAIGNKINHSSPVQEMTRSTWKQVASQYGGFWGIKTDGTLWAWGLNDFGMLGQNNTINRSSPVQIATGGNSWIQIAGGQRTFVGLLSNGTLWGCGYTSEGSLDNGMSFMNLSSPIQIAASKTWKSIYGNDRSYIAIEGIPVTPAPTNSPTATPIPTGTTTPSPTPTESPTPTPTASPVGPTATPIPTGTVTPTPTVTASPTPTTTASPTPTSTATPTPTPSASCYYNINFAAVENGATIGNTTPGSNATTSDSYYGPNAYNYYIDTTYNSWPAIGALVNYNSTSTVNRTNCIDRSNKINTNNSTFNGQGSAAAPFCIVIDLGQLRTFNQAIYYQTFSDGKCTHAALDISSTGNLETRTSTNWTQIHGFNVLDNSSTSNGTVVNMPLKTARYLRLRIYNDGRYSDTSYTELYNFKLFFDPTYPTPTPTPTPSPTSGVNQLWSWGSSPQIGRGTSSSGSPAQVQGVLYKGVPKLGYLSNSLTAAMIDSDGSLYMWGANSNFNVGDGSSNASVNSPILTGLLTSDWMQISTNYNATAAIKTNGTLWMWGNNDANRLLMDVNTPIWYSTPVQMGTATNWKKVLLGDDRAIALKTDNTLWCWGSNYGGQCGQPNTVTSCLNPTQITGSWSDIATGLTIGFGIRTDGTLWTWGYSNYNENGAGFAATNYSPVKIGTGTNWRSIVGGNGGHVLATKTDGSLWGWGANSRGQATGNNTVALSQSTPFRIGLANDWDKISVGTMLSAAIKTDGSLWVWGTNRNGTIGLNLPTTMNFSSPVQTIISDYQWLDLSVVSYNNNEAILAVRTQIPNPSPSPQPSATMSPTPTPTPSPSRTLTPTPSPSRSPTPTPSPTPPVLVFNYTGAEQSYTLPAHVTSIKVTAIGATGGSDGFATAGAGANVYSVVSVTGGSTIRIVVGGTPTSNTAVYGYAGSGGSAPNASNRGFAGGGLSGVFSNSPVARTNALVIAAGGGGVHGRNVSTGAGGSGGKPNGGNGQASVPTDPNYSATPGLGATQFGGGAAGTRIDVNTTNPTAGASLNGGNGGTTGIASHNGGGGGGGGYYGGGGGAGGGDACATGGGGSSYSVSSITYGSDNTTGNGQVTITW